MTRPSITLAAAFWAATAPGPASAGTRLFGGYDFTSQQATADRDGRNRHGLAGALDHDFLGALGLKAQAGYGSRRSGNVEDSHTLLVGGPAYYVVRSRRLDIFVHALAGVIRRSEGFAIFDASVSRSGSHPAGLAGGGVDIGWTDSFAIRLEGGYLLSGGAADELGRVRAGHAAAGLVYRFGLR